MGAIFPDITVKFSGQDSNIFSLRGSVTRAMKRSGVSSAKVDDFVKTLFNSQSYDEAIQVCMKWVNVT